MNTNSPLSQTKPSLPNIYSIESSEKAFGNAFLTAAQVLVRCLDQFQVNVRCEDFTRDFNSNVFWLFSKMCKHYYSYVLLEIHQDERGSQFLIEQLREAAITLAYLLEEGDQELFSNYLSASLHQAQDLLTDVEEELSKSPNSIELKDLKVELQNIINKYLTKRSFKNHPNDSKTYLWGNKGINTTDERGAILGLSFLNNSARRIALRVAPASWLECQISRSDFANIRNQANPGINFTELRDAAHLCLHTTRILIEEIVNDRDFNLTDLKEQQQLFNTLFEWFHDAHNAYQMNCCVNQEKLT